MLTFKCIIFLLGSENGGLAQPIKNGSMPSFNFDNELVACKVYSNEGAEFLVLEELLNVNIKVASYFEDHSKLKKGVKFKLNIASQVIGHGIILENQLYL